MEIFVRINRWAIAMARRLTLQRLQRVPCWRLMYFASSPDRPHCSTSSSQRMGVYRMDVDPQQLQEQICPEGLAGAG